MYTTRYALKEDIPAIVKLWTKMTIEMSEPDGTPLPTEQRIEEVSVLFIERFNSNKLIFRVAVNEQDEIVACAGGLLRDDYAWPLSVTPEQVGWVVSVYTEVAHRKQGLAQKVVDEVCEWLKLQSVSMIRLWASQHGKPVYEKLGFYQTTFMEKHLN